MLNYDNFINIFVYKFTKYIKLEEIKKYINIQESFTLENLNNLDKDVLEANDYVKKMINIDNNNNSMFFNKEEPLIDFSESKDGFIKYQGLQIIYFLSEKFKLVNYELSFKLNDYISLFIHDVTHKILNEKDNTLRITNIEIMNYLEKNVNFKIPDNKKLVNKILNSISNELSLFLKKYIINEFLDVIFTDIKTQIKNKLLLVYNEEDIERFIHNVEIHNLIYPALLEDDIKNIFNTSINNELYNYILETISKIRL